MAIRDFVFCQGFIPNFYTTSHFMFPLFYVAIALTISKYNVLIPTSTVLGMQVQIMLFTLIFGFCVWPWRHFCRRLWFVVYCFHHSIWQAVWMVIHFPSSLKFWYLHQLSDPGGHRCGISFVVAVWCSHVPICFPTWPIHSSIPMMISLPYDFNGSTALNSFQSPSLRKLMYLILYHWRDHLHSSHQEPPWHHLLHC